MGKSLQSPIDMNRQRFARHWPCVVLVGLLVGLTGCGSKLASVSGAVRLDGKPLAAAGIMFHPKDGSPVSSGVTDAEGRYRIESGNTYRIKPGEYSVTVSKTRTTGVSATGIPVPGQVKTEYLAPVQYATPAASPLRVTVAEGSQTHDFELTSSPTPPSK
jgi:hypothetical protein